jgi:hypothetical protein
VGEEGLDIAECDLVVFYDVVASEIRLIQRKGRTARHREGKVIILYCKGTHDEIYLRIALNKLKKMNLNLKGSHKKPNSELVSIKENNKKKQIVATNATMRDTKLASSRQHQVNLHSFIENLPSDGFEKRGDKPSDLTAKVKIGKFLPMKFGIRRKLQNDDIEFILEDMDLHIVLFNKVLIQIYNPRRIKEEDFNVEIREFSEICELLILIFDFVDFEEQIPGERRALKLKIKELKQEHNFQFIPVEIEEELYFIISSILESPSGRRL